jgi:hypothetical protein
MALGRSQQSGDNIAVLLHWQRLTPDILAAQSFPKGRAPATSHNQPVFCHANVRLTWRINHQETRLTQFVFFVLVDEPRITKVISGCFGDLKDTLTVKGFRRDRQTASHVVKRKIKESGPHFRCRRRQSTVSRELLIVACQILQAGESNRNQPGFLKVGVRETPALAQIGPQPMRQDRGENLLGRLSIMEPP